jgi:FkbM family methyltransferase
VPIAVDTFLLRCTARWRRLRAKASGMAACDAPNQGRIVHLDLGLHRSAAQISLMLEWFGHLPKFEVWGFEAHPGYFRHCRRKFADEKRVKLLNLALVGPDHQGDTAALHLDGRKGLGNSLFAARGDETIDVPAARLSRVLAEQVQVAPGDVVTLRMNIEGAEMFVIDDLRDAGMLGMIDGFYGMWDDLYKIDPALDARFRALLKREKIRNFPFNDRDLSPIAGRGRREIIRYDIETALRRGARRKLLPPAARQ